MQPTGFRVFYHIVSHVPVRHPFGYHAKGCRCLRNSEEWDDIEMGNPPPHYHPPAKSLVAIVSSWSRGQEFRTNCLFYSLYIVFLVRTEDLYCYTFVVIGAFPNVAKPTGARGCSDVRVGLSERMWEAGRSPVRPQSCQNRLNILASCLVAVRACFVQRR